MSSAHSLSTLRGELERALFEAKGLPPRALGDDDRFLELLDFESIDTLSLLVSLEQRLGFRWDGSEDFTVLLSSFGRLIEGVSRKREQESLLP